MPIFANAIGPLELLPNHRYGAGWLRVTFNHQEVFSLPEAKEGVADPYAQIYLERNAWWRLMDPAWINPSNKKEVLGLPKQKDIDVWDGYCDRVLAARSFHLELGGYYHFKSFVHYGGDEGHRAFNRVCWSLRPVPQSKGYSRAPSLIPRMPSKRHALALCLVKDDYEGRLQLVNELSEKSLVSKERMSFVVDTLGDGYVADLQAQDQVGDGTVPRHSAEDAAKAAIFSACMTGYEHQGSYANENVQSLTLYSILRLASSIGK